MSFYQRKEIKDVISYFRLVVNPDDEEAFKRTINYPTRGIGKTTIDKIIDVSANNGVSLWTVLCNPFIYGLDVNKGTYAKMQGFRELIESFIADDINKNAYEIQISENDTKTATRYTVNCINSADVTLNDDTIVLDYGKTVRHNVRTNDNTSSQNASVYGIGSGDLA